MHTHQPLRRQLGTLAPLLIGLMAITACGGDDGDSADRTDAPAATTVAPTTTSAPDATPAPSESSGAPDVTDAAAPTSGVATGDEEFCEVVFEINDLGGPPSMELMERYQAVAPDELQEPVQLLIDVATEAGGDFTAVFGDPEALQAVDEITAVEEATCDLPADEGSDQDPSVTVLDTAATRIDIEATEYMFHGELPTTAGRYSFVMTNAGEQPHIMVLVRLEDGAVLEDVLAAEGEVGVAEEFESGFAPPGSEGILTADLGPGSWVLLCPIPGPDGQPHFVDGMIHEFTIA